jgi:hypothetical protein
MANLEERIRARLAQLKTDRERVALTLAQFDAAIGEIEALLVEPVANPAAPPDLPEPLKAYTDEEQAAIETARPAQRAAYEELEAAGPNGSGDPGEIPIDRDSFMRP